MITILAILAKIKNFVVKYWRQLLLVSLGAFLMLKAQGCAKKLFPPKTPVSGPSSPTVPVLPKDDREIIKVDTQHNQTTVTTEKGTTTVTGTRDVTVEVKKNGQVVVKEKTIGFECRPGLGAHIGPDGGRLDLTVDWGYWKRVDGLVGIGTDFKNVQNTDIFIGAAYQFSNKLPNTSIFGGINQHKNPLIGLRVRF